mmetsp:Transcript_119363/g.382576  ORF Transcript_119363/g.382576 Transcript_119363/m.382576 type:complete len:213 (-) Transcript_119363:240-878(-)
MLAPTSIATSSPVASGGPTAWSSSAQSGNVPVCIRNPSIGWSAPGRTQISTEGTSAQVSFDAPSSTVCTSRLPTGQPPVRTRVRCISASSLHTGKPAAKKRIIWSRYTEATCARSEPTLLSTAHSRASRKPAERTGASAVRPRATPRSTVPKLSGSEILFSPVGPNAAIATGSCPNRIPLARAQSTTNSSKGHTAQPLRVISAMLYPCLNTS